jgi:Tol biopolymer transport system component
MNADGTEQVQLTSGEEPNYRPAVSPDGSKVIFACSNDDHYDICLMNVDGSNVQNLTQSDINELYPAWLSDTTIAFIQEQGRGRNMIRMIVQMALNVPSEVTPLFGQGMMVTDFAASANGDMLAATVSAQGPQGLENRMYLIPTDPDGVPVEVPRADARDQLVSPSFWRR